MIAQVNQNKSQTIKPNQIEGIVDESFYLKSVKIGSSPAQILEFIVGDMKGYENSAVKKFISKCHNVARLSQFLQCALKQPKNFYAMFLRFQQMRLYCSGNYNTTSEITAKNLYFRISANFRKNFIWIQWDTQGPGGN